MGVRCSGLESISGKRHKVQLRASKIFEGFCDISNEERLKRLNITSLKDRRVRGDLIEMYKLIRGLDKIDKTKSPLLRTNIDFTGPAQMVRGNRLRLRREVPKSSARNTFASSVTQRHNFFTNRVTPRWN